jgi:hypothetical protein
MQEKNNKNVQKILSCDGLCEISCASVDAFFHLDECENTQATYLGTRTGRGVSIGNTIGGKGDTASVGASTAARQLFNEK